MYKNYIFDLYGTLIDIHTNENKRHLWDKMALFYNFNGADYTALELKREYKRLCVQEERTLADQDYHEIEILNVFKTLFVNKSVVAETPLIEQAAKIFRILSLEYIRLYEGVLDLLEELKKAGKKIYLLSNAQRVFTEPEMKMLNIYEYFDGILFSSVEGCKKPSPLFYKAIIDKYQLDIKECIMIGNDEIADIKGAYDVGLHSLYIHSNISPELSEMLLSTYSIMDGDVYKVKELILRK